MLNETLQKKTLKPNNTTGVLEIATIIPGCTNNESWLRKNAIGFKRIKGYRPSSAHATTRGFSFPHHVDLGPEEHVPQTVDNEFNYNMGQTRQPVIDVRARKDYTGTTKFNAAPTGDANAAKRTQRPSTAGASQGVPRNETYMNDDSRRNNATGRTIHNVPFLEASVPPKLLAQEFVEVAMRTKHQNHELNRVYSKHHVEHSHPEEPTQQVVRAVEETDPDFSDETKIVCRYIGYISQPRAWEERPTIGNPVVETEMIRTLTVAYYIHDSTVSIFEKQLKNVGLSGGAFFAKGVLLHDGEDNSRVTVYDLIPGQSIRVLGTEIFISSADKATRHFCEEKLALQLPADVPIPEGPREDIGMLLTLGMGGKDFPPRADNKFPPTYEFFQRREQNMKTRRYLFNESRPLRFDCIEINDREDNGALKFAEFRAWEANNHKPGHGTMVVPNTIRRNCLIYFISDYCLEIQLGYWPNQPQKHREDGTLLKRTKLQKNWREATKGKKEPTYYEPQDFEVGKIIDLYGRFYLLVGCDAYTQTKYQEMGVTQKHIAIEMLIIPPIVMPIPQLGDGFLAIGKPEETLATVYGQKAPKPPEPGSFKVVNRGRELRCMAKLISDRPEDQQRQFAVTYYIESDHINIYEEVVRNSGIWGGTFLSKGRYLNYLPHDGEIPRYFKPQDIYLGNVISPNNVMMRINEMDAVTLKFCENNPDEFPYSDTFEIILRLLDEVVGNAVNARRICKLQDRSHMGAFKKEQFVAMLDLFVSSSTRDAEEQSVQIEESLSVASANAIPPAERKRRKLNDQELLTMLRRFHNDKLDVYHYDELCDLFSYLYFVRDLQNKAPRFGVIGSLAELEKVLRPSQKQWRRMFRMDEKCVYGIIGAGHAKRIFTTNRIEISDDCLQEIAKKFSASSRESNKYNTLFGIVLGATQGLSRAGSGVEEERAPSSGTSVATSASRVSRFSHHSTSTKGTVSSLLTKKKAGKLVGLSRGNGSDKADSTTLLASGNANTLSIKDKRKELTKSLMRTSNKQGDTKHSGTLANKNVTAKLDLECAVINIHALFDDLFKAEWAF